MTEHHDTDDAFDVVVVGGGPAGAAVSTFLQRGGASCLVLEKDVFPRYHVGESLIPHTFGTLDRLGLLPALRGSAFPVKQSVRFVAVDGRESQPFYFSDTVEGEAARTWQVERADFDRICLDNARDAGVTVRMQTRVDEVLFDGARAIGVLARGRGAAAERRGAYRVRANVVVDATGRAALLGDQLDLKETVPGLRKASIWGYYRGGRRLDGIDAGETTILMIPESGWFWYIPLPDDIVSVGIVASPDVLFAATTSFKDVFLREVAACAPLQERLATAERVGPVRGIRQLAYRNRQTAGQGWVMVGDAAEFLDPVYSSGLFLALASAELAAECIADALDHDDPSPERLGAFHPRLSRGVQVIRSVIDAFYDPRFRFRAFLERFPEHRTDLIDCLVGDVLDKDMSAFVRALSR